MINHISINNFAIIENTEIDFENGLNIITGETGAGKSIVIEAISLALGSRADSSFVRHGEKKAVVQLAGELGGNEIVITREVSATGKNLCKLNGEIVTLGELSKVCNKVADIHGQYDNQSLLNPDSHIQLVDNYHYDNISPVKSKFKKVYDSYLQAKSKLNKLLSMESETNRKMDFYRFEKAEIENANLVLGEDETLSERVLMLQNSEKIFEGIEIAYNSINSGESSMFSTLGTALHSLQSITEYSKDISSLADDFQDIYFRMEDLSSALRNIREQTNFTPEELDQAISRLDLIDNLKKKYGKSISDILEYHAKITDELDQIENFDKVKEDLQNEVSNTYDELHKIANNLTKMRKQSGSQLEAAIESELHQLNFDSAKLSIKFAEPEVIGPDGNDIVEILMSTNKGEPLKPLVKVASGGEISRIMLAIKNITGTYDNIPTMIFDEIDSGISGITASIVGRKLREISSNHQIICITHLPQIAACGDENYKIYKESDDNSTYTHVEKLSDNEKIDEIARLLGGETITDTTRESAKELVSSFI